MITALFAKFGSWIVAGLSLIGAGFVAWNSAKKAGKAEAKADASEQRASDREAIAVRQINEQREASAREVETVERANDVKEKNSAVDDAGVVVKLRDEWSRD